MLIYTNHLTLEPENGADSVLALLAGWLSWKTKEPIDTAMLLSDVTEWAYRDQGVLLTEFCPAVEGDFGFKADFSHVDFKVPTRRWSTEIEIHQAQNDHYVECTVSVSVVDQVRTNAPRPISSRPRLLVDIVEKCRPVVSTPGLFTKELTLDTCEKFLNDATRIGRKAPIVVLSCRPNGESVIEVDRLQEQLLGLADFYFIPPHADTEEMIAAIGEGLMAVDGGARILWPVNALEEDMVTTRVWPIEGGVVRTRQELEGFICQKIMKKNAKAKADLTSTDEAQ